MIVSNGYQTDASRTRSSRTAVKTDRAAGTLSDQDRDNFLAGWAGNRSQLEAARRIWTDRRILDALGSVMV
ncbi:MAG: hypothetical protein H7311_10625 [Ramlibacter sp.]|nr:hypothetical protein [Cryobacterium sp.]